MFTKASLSFEFNVHRGWLSIIISSKYHLYTKNDDDFINVHSQIIVLQDHLHKMTILLKINFVFKDTSHDSLHIIIVNKDC